MSAADQRALLAGIENEKLIPTKTVPLSGSKFTDDLDQISPLLSSTQAAYVLLKVDSTAPDGFVAITFVPNAAPVRQKMLFASTRLTLVRELGIERFRQTLFTTDPEELTAKGWEKHEMHEKLSAPLTEEEAGLASVKAAEAQESQGTSTRRGHVSSKVNVPTGEGVLEALASLMEESCKGTLVQLKYQLPDETLTLDSSSDSVSPEQVAELISPSEPRYSFYSHPSSPGAEPHILFVYTCPSISKIKERMVYSTSKSWTRVVAERDAGIAVSKTLEATEPSDLTVDALAEGIQTPGSTSTESKPSGFARPKRPGRR